jgi:hypothetical protein
MDPVDVLTMAVEAAQAVRSADDPEAVLASAYGLIGSESPSDESEAMAIRIARLIDRAGERRRDVLDFLESQAARLYRNRLAHGWGAGHRVEDNTLIAPDPEAVRLRGVVEASARRRWADCVPLFGKGPAPFAIASREAVMYFDGGDVAAHLEGQGAARGSNPPGGLPHTVRGLIDYPMAVPVLFSIETGEAPWYVWKICCAFADQYEKIYEEPGRYGIWGHDLADLWIDGMAYFPGENLVYPWTSS